MKLKILLTFDYELPLGGVQSYDKGLFEPAEKLLMLANELGVPVVLFADICSAIRFRSWDTRYYDQFKSQLQSALRDQHDVQLHIHPHWMETEFENRRFIPSPKYGLSDFSDHTELPIETIIDMSVHALNEICTEADPGYRCIAFRAGGYNVEPESRRILHALEQAGIRIESSVIPGLYQNFSFSKIDYRDAPRKSHWSISKDGPLISAGASGIAEYPISRMPLTLPYLTNRMTRKLRLRKQLRQRKYNNTGKGYYAISQKQNLIDRFRMALNPVVLTFDREYTTLRDLEQITDWNIRQFAGEEELYLTLISHPKSMGDYHRDTMRQYVDRMRFKYHAEFVTYRVIPVTAGSEAKAFDVLSK